jgi:Icc-related predicted phosphoesterase
MKIGVISDLHLSRGPQLAPVNDCDVYALAGDIGKPAEAIAWARELGKPVLYVPGNHEFYGRTMTSTMDELRRLAQGTAVHVLDNEELCIGGVRFLGSTLWTDFLLDGAGQSRDVAMREAVEKVHDFRRIFIDDEQREVFTPYHSEMLFGKNAAWLEQRLKRSWPGPTVVITHHAPSAASIDPRFAGSPLNACFASNLDRLLGEGANMWIHGHMHHSVNRTIRGTHVLCNPRGYVRDGVNENRYFDVNFSVEITPPA